MNNEHMTRILNDYADQSKTCWASDSGKAVSECWCAQCAEGRIFYPVAVELDAEIRQLRASLDNSRASESRALALAEAKREQFNRASNYIQASIDRGEWEQSELEEPFWEELADLMGLNISLTKEVDVKFTVTYTGTVTVPRDFSESDIDTDENWTHQINVMYGGKAIEDQYVTYEDCEIEVDN